MSSEAAPSSAGKIVIVGASGLIGQATVAALEKCIGADRIEICTRDPSNLCAASYASSGCRVVKADMSDITSLKSALGGASAVYLVTPGAENRSTLVSNGLAACQEAGVPFVLLLSTPDVAFPDTVFGKQFGEIEYAARSISIPCCILRFPMFTDDLCTDSDTIRNEGKFYGSIAPTSYHTTVAVDDCGAAACAILKDPSKHVGRTYTICGPAWCNQDLEEAFSEVLGARIAYKHLSYGDMGKRLAAVRGWQQWQINAVTDVWQLVDEGQYEFDAGDFKRLTGRDPTGLRDWLEQHKMEFSRLGGSAGRYQAEAAQASPPSQAFSSTQAAAGMSQSKQSPTSAKALSGSGTYIQNTTLEANLRG